MGFLGFGKSDEDKAAEAKAQADKLRQGQLQDYNKLTSLIKNGPKYQSSLATPEFQKMRAEAFGGGPMALYEAQRKAEADRLGGVNQGIQNQLHDEMENTAVSQAGQQSNAYSQLAMGGGLSSGARERIASTGAVGGFAARQAARLASQRAGQDAQNASTANLGSIGTAEAGARLAQQNSITDSLNKDLAAKNQYGLDQYNKNADLTAGFLKSGADARVQQIYGKT